MSAHKVPISADALRMRCRRLCERKNSGRANVSEDIQADYKAGGERREVVEMALLEAIAKHGTGRNVYHRVKAGVSVQTYNRNLLPFQGEFVTKCKVIRERLSAKEREVNGRWLTEELLHKEYSKKAAKAIKSYCLKFPDALTRRGANLK